jgi:hypothetical protein
MSARHERTWSWRAANAAAGEEEERSRASRGRGDGWHVIHGVRAEWIVTRLGRATGDFVAVVIMKGGVS